MKKTLIVVMLALGCISPCIADGFFVTNGEPQRAGSGYRIVGPVYHCDRSLCPRTRFVTYSNLTPYPFYPYYSGVYVEYNVTDYAYNESVARDYDELSRLEEKRYEHTRAKKELLDLKIINAVYSSKNEPSVKVKAQNDLPYGISEITATVTLKYDTTSLLLNDIIYSFESVFKRGRQKQFIIPLSGVKIDLPESASVSVDIVRLKDSKGKPVPEDELSANDIRRINDLRKKLKISPESRP